MFGARARRAQGSKRASTREGRGGAKGGGFKQAERGWQKFEWNGEVGEGTVLLTLVPSVWRRLQRGAVEPAGILSSADRVGMPLCEESWIGIMFKHGILGARRQTHCK